MTSALLISTYDLGHQPFGLASPAAWLARDGVSVRCLDLARDRLDEEAVRAADLVAFHLPMHTATRMAAPIIRRVRGINPAARICAYGLYAPLNGDWLREIGVDEVLGVESEEALSAIARAVPTQARDSSATQPLVQQEPVREASRSFSLPKLQFITPDRSSLPRLSRYAGLQMGDGTTRTAGYTEASRGCRHLCRHCPVVPVYNGQFRVVQPEVVLADIANQVAAGATHISFGDPDFFNGPTHALRIVEQLHKSFPSVSYDVTIKVEHLLRYRDRLPVLRDTGCVFVTSAVESIDDRVLALLEKGHTRRDFIEVAERCRDIGLVLSPTFVPFHPWTTLDGYRELLALIVALDLVEQVAPIQLAIRLLVPAGSRLLEVEEIRGLVSAFDKKTLTHVWTHPDPLVDLLQTDVAALVGRRLMSERATTFSAIWVLAHERAGLSAPPLPDRHGKPVPYMDEPWYCCAEPSPEQLTLV